MTRMHVVVDCGGTSSRAELHVEGREVVRIDGDASLSGYLEPARIGAVMRELLAPLEDRYRDLGAADPEVAVVIAAAGFVDSLRAGYRSAAEEVVAAAFDGAVGSVTVVNDAVALLLGHGAEAVVVAGTGSSVLVRTDDGGAVQGGGDDWVAADEGAGFWIGLDGIRAVKRSLEGGVDSALLAAFTRIYDVEPAGVPGMFRELAVAGPRMKARIARFASGVCDAAAAGDSEALGIVTRQVGGLVATAERAIRAAALSATTVRIVTGGGMMRDELYRTLFCTGVESSDLMNGRRVEWVRVDDGLAATRAMAEYGPGWPEALGGHRPLVVDRT